MDIESLTCHEKYNLAENPNTPSETLARLVVNGDFGVLRRVLANPNTPQHIKECLFEGLLRSEKHLMARIPYTPPEILDRLADDGYPYSVAENPNTSPETLARLADDTEYCVRQVVAENPNTSPATLDRLANDEWAVVRQVVAYNQNTSPATLDRLANDEWAVVRYSVAENQNTSPETLARLADYEDKWVRSNVARNLNTPKHIKEYLTAIEFFNNYTKD
jgi:hypothetical protein